MVVVLPVLVGIVLEMEEEEEEEEELGTMESRDGAMQWSDARE